MSRRNQPGVVERHRSMPAFHFSLPKALYQEYSLNKLFFDRLPDIFSILDHQDEPDYLEWLDLDRLYVKYAVRRVDMKFIKVSSEGVLRGKENKPVLF